MLGQWTRRVTCSLPILSPVTPDTSGQEAITAILDAYPEPQRSTLKALRDTVKRLVPKAGEQVKYQVPSFTVAGQGLLGYQARKDGCSLYPMSGTVLKQLPSLPEGVTVTEGSLHFGADQTLSKTFLRTLIDLKRQALANTASGTRIETFPDGGVKAIGQMRSGALHGKWHWYRADGSLMRVGSFRSGEPTGWWETWSADGERVSRVKKSPSAR